MNFGFVLKEGLAGFQRAKFSAIGSIFTITISLLLVGLFYIVTIHTSRLVESMREKVELEAFLAEPLSRQRINNIENQILSFEGVESVKFISKEEAARIFQNEFGENIYKVLDFNPLPASFKIFLKEGYRTPKNAGAIHKQIMEINGVDNIAYRKELLDFLDRRVKMLSTVGLAVGIFLAISAIFLVSNTIRLTIYAKRKSVQTMKLVGASRWLVRTPFIIEGILQGFVGGLIAAVIIYYLLTFAAGFISTELVEFFQIDLPFYISVILAGIFLGFFGSAISVRRFISETVG
ncbi:MAG: permease-like cell division protein FtsX [Bacteroidota bacterium]|nr:permease-like cell division protein FtsX [Bacteroidota bacterium]